MVVISSSAARKFRVKGRNMVEFGRGPRGDYASGLVCVSKWCLFGLGNGLVIVYLVKPIAFLEYIYLFVCFYLKLEFNLKMFGIYLLAFMYVILMYKLNVQLYKLQCVIPCTLYLCMLLLCVPHIYIRCTYICHNFMFEQNFCMGVSVYTMYEAASSLLQSWS